MVTNTLILIKIYRYKKVLIQYNIVIYHRRCYILTTEQKMHREIMESPTIDLILML